MPLSEDQLAAFVAFERDGWARAAEPFHRLWGPLTRQSAEPLLDAAGVGPGSRVLDVASGAGYLSAAAAARGAEATGLDFAPEQVALAGRNFPGVRFREGDAEDLPFGAGQFDAVVIGYGVNHLPHPERGIAEAFRVLRRGGRLAFTVWAPPQPGEGFGIVLGAIAEHGDPGVMLPPAPPYFRFADPAEVHPVLLAAGFREPQTRLVPQAWQHDTPDRLFEAFGEGAVRATEMLRSQPEAARERIRTAVRSAVEPLRHGDGYRIPVPAALSSARKP
jgi:SAM-dependent methyltransferase